MMDNNNPKLAFGKTNYRLFFLCLGVITLGFVLMSLDQTPFGFGFMGLTLGPIVLFLGFVLGFVAILYPPTKK